jgi:hypothetical protein
MLTIYYQSVLPIGLSLNITVKIKFPEPSNVSITVISAVTAAEEIILVWKWTQNSFFGIVGCFCSILFDVKT